MSSIAAHIQAARESGPAAGLRAYLRVKAPTSADRRADILASPDKLVRYCEIFGDQIGLNGSATASAARAKVDENDRQSVAERILAKLGIDLSEVTGGIQVVADEPTRKRTPAKDAPANVLAKGDEFLYHGTNLISTWTVTSVHKAHVKASNGKRESNWKHVTVAKLVKSGKIDLI